MASILPSSLFFSCESAGLIIVWKSTVNLKLNVHGNPMKLHHWSPSVPSVWVSSLAVLLLHQGDVYRQCFQFSTFYNNTPLILQRLFFLLRKQLVMNVATCFHQSWTIFPQSQLSMPLIQMTSLEVSVGSHVVVMRWDSFTLFWLFHFLTTETEKKSMTTAILGILVYLNTLYLDTESSREANR